MAYQVTDRSPARRFLVEAHRPPGNGYRVDPAVLPPVYKRYPAAPRLVLPETGGLSWLREVNGVTRIRWMRGIVPLGLSPSSPAFPGARSPDIRLAPGRAVPSSGARYPIETYLATGVAGATGEAGLYHYDPAHHVLERLRAGDYRTRISACLDMQAPRNPYLVLLFSTVFWRNSAKYGEFGYRLQCLDAGAVVAQALVVAEGAGFTGAVHFGFCDDGLDALLGLAPAAESVLAVVALTSGKTSEATHSEASDWTGPVPTERPPATDIRTVPGLARMVELQDASRRPGPGRLGARPPAPSTGPPVPAGATALSGGLRRRRTVHGYQSCPMPLADLTRLLAAVAGPIEADLPIETTLSCVTTRIDGLEPGAYRYDRRGGLRRTRRGDAIAALVDAALNPALAEECRNASLTLAPVGDVASWLAKFGDRGYRMLTVTAGIVAQRVCLAASALGLDSHVHCDVDPVRLDEALGLADGPLASLVLITVGVPRTDRLDPQQPL